VTPLELPEDDLEASRAELRRWLAEHPDPGGATLAEAGLVAPHYPRPWGLGAGPQLQLLPRTASSSPAPTPRRPSTGASATSSST